MGFLVLFKKKNGMDRGDLFHNETCASGPKPCPLFTFLLSKIKAAALFGKCE